MTDYANGDACIYYYHEVDIDGGTDDDVHNVVFSHVYVVFRNTIALLKASVLNVIPH